MPNSAKSRTAQNPESAKSQTATHGVSSNKPTRGAVESVWPSEVEHATSTTGATVAGRSERPHRHRDLSEEAVMTHSHDGMAEVPAVNIDSALATYGPDWDTEDAYWQSAYPERKYARADRSYEYYRAAYRYGAERAMRWGGR